MLTNCRLFWNPLRLEHVRSHRDVGVPLPVPVQEAVEVANAKNAPASGPGRPRALAAAAALTSQAAVGRLVADTLDGLRPDS